MLHFIHRLRTLLCLSLLLLPALSAFASHIVGTDLTYAWVSGNTYKVTLAVYADCGPASAGAFSTLPSATPQVCVYNGSSPVATLSLMIEAPSGGLEVTPPLCAGLVSQCTNTSSAIPGIKLFIYSTTYTFTGTSAVWRFVFSGSMGPGGSAGRAAAITNIMSAGGTSMQLVDTLSNISGHNSNPVLNVIPLPYYSNNVMHHYNPVAIDAEGDSLVYTLISATNGTASCTSTGSAVTYIPGVSASAPLLSVPGSFSFGSSTGQITFQPNALQRAVAVYHIQEYRAGVLVGTVEREMTILVINDANNLPGGGFSAPTACTLTDSVHIAACDTTASFSVQIHAADADVLDTIEVTAFGLPAGATFSTVGNNTPHPVSTFSWGGPMVSTGMHTFYVKYKDNACPMAGYQVIAYDINVAHCVAGTSGVCPAPPTAGINIFPNPTHGSFTIALPGAIPNAAVTVADIYGRVVRQYIVAYNSNTVLCDLDGLTDGTYAVQVVSGSETYREKIVLSR